MLRKTAYDVRRRARDLIMPVLLAALAVAIADTTAAQTVLRNPEFDYVVDVPAGWTVVDGSDASFISFADPDRVAVFQVVAFPGDQFATVEALDGFIRDRFSATGESDRFEFHDTPAVFADLSFDAGVSEVRGYMVFLNGDDHDIALMTLVPADRWEDHHDFLLSALDSFSSDVNRTLPGPVSVYFTAEVEVAAGGSQAPPPPAGGSARREGAAPGPQDGDDPAEGTITLPSGRTWPLPAPITHPELVDAAQVLIEREARVLSAYAPPADAPTRFDEESEGAPLWAVAWRRYFRAIYRDNFERLTPVAEELFHDLAEAGVAREEMPSVILEWLQRAQYERTRSLSDLMSPAACLIAFAGDCDSLGITYAILLEQLGFDAILMVSVEFAHAMAGVDIEGEGARFPFDGREWLVAELTEPVGIGRIAREVSDIGGWIGVRLDPTQP